MQFIVSHGGACFITKARQPAPSGDSQMQRAFGAHLTSLPEKRRPTARDRPQARAAISTARSADFSRPSSVSNFCSSASASSCAALASSI